VNLSEVTPLILTFNEEANLARVLDSLRWARQIAIIDSGSTDATRDIAMSHNCVQFIEREFDNHANQWNFGLQHVTSDWTLALDADYVCGEDLPRELEALNAKSDAYAASFVYAIAGRALRGTLYPSRVVLFRTDRFSYFQDGHTQSLDVGGATVDRLRSKIIHDDRKPLGRWLQSQQKYAALEADKLLATGNASIGWKDWLRKQILWAPPLTLLYCLLFKGLIIDGWRGIYYSLQRTYAELLLSLELLDRRFAHPKNIRPGPQATNIGNIKQGITLEHTRD
jgi:glycosyltransferase involved in cell wall biosynthesis